LKYTLKSAGRKPLLADFFIALREGVAKFISTADYVNCRFVIANPQGEAIQSSGLFPLDCFGLSPSQ
jgi:hypothetical protein